MFGNLNIRRPDFSDLSDTLSIPEFSGKICDNYLMPLEIQQTRNPFATFAVAPRGVTFESQETGEKIILLLRQHLVVLVLPILTILILLVLPVFVSPVLSFLKLDIKTFLSDIQILLLMVFWYLLVFAFSIYRFIFWYFNVYILTNERIIDFDFKGILSKSSSFAKLMQIEDVSPKMIGFFSTFFNYGDIFIQTAGEQREFDFLKVPRPDQVAQRILEEVRIEEGEEPGIIA